MLSGVLGFKKTQQPEIKRIKQNKLVKTKKLGIGLTTTTNFIE